MAIKKYYVTVDEDGKTHWYKDAKCDILHRIDGAAIEWANGSKEWYQNGQRHCTVGPAIDNANGFRAWYQNGLLHRTDGPAIEYADGSKRWYINGKQLTKAKFLAATRPVVELTIADIEKLVGKRVKIIK